MSVVTRAASKLKFQTADAPSQADFEDLHDSIQWYDESWAFKRYQIIAGHESAGEVFTNVLSGNYLRQGGTSRTPALGSVLSAANRIGYVTAAGAGSTAFINSPPFFFRGNAVGQGGFDLISKIGIPVIAAGTIWYHGMSATHITAATTNVSTLTNKFGFCKDSGDTNIHLIHNDSSGACTKVDTGMAVDNTTIYLIRLRCDPNDAAIYATLYDIENDLSYDSGAISADIPANTQGLSWELFISNNATASAVATDLIQVTTITNH
jgi:hypothetical protein